MKITINQINLQKAILAAEKIVGKNSSLPILNNILFKTENGRLKISATNLELGLNYFIGAKIDEVGEITIPSRIISEFINIINDEKLTLTTKNNTLTISSPNYKTNILGFNTSDFPIIPKIKSNFTYTIPSYTLKDVLTTILNSISLSETTPELSGAFIQFLPNQIIGAATDSFRLTEKSSLLKNGHSSSFILPRITVAEITRIISDIEEDVKISVGENQISFSTEDFELISRLIEGNYPDYKKVIPSQIISHAVVKRDELEKQVRIAGLFASAISDIKLICLENKIEIISKNPNKGEAKVTLSATLKGDPFDLTLNYQYLLDGLKVIPHNEVFLGFAGPNRPLIIRPEEKNGELTYLVMPLRGE